MRSTVTRQTPQPVNPVVSQQNPTTYAVLEDSGQPVAVILSVEDYRRLSLFEGRERTGDDGTDGELANGFHPLNPRADA